MKCREKRNENIRILYIIATILDVQQRQVPRLYGYGGKKFRYSILRGFVTIHNTTRPSPSKKVGLGIV